MKVVSCWETFHSTRELLGGVVEVGKVCVEEAFSARSSCRTFGELQANPQALDEMPQAGG
jgi:hypothetical protein